MNAVALTLAHAAVGIVLLALGLAAFLTPKHRRSPHVRVGEAYFWVMSVVVVSGLVDGAARQLRDGGGISPFEIVSIPTWCFALAGYLLAKRRPRDWLRWHITAQGSSFIGIVTAGSFLARGRIVPDTLLVNLICWLTPQTVGAILIVRVTLRLVGPPRHLRRMRAAWLRNRERAASRSAEAPGISPDAAPTRRG